MSAAAKRNRDFAHVRAGFSAQAHANQAILALAQQRRNFHGVDVADGVDDALGVLVGRAAVGDIRERDGRNADPPVLIELRFVHAKRVEFELVKRYRAKQAAVEKRQIDASVEDVRRDAHRIRRRVAVRKVTGIGRDGRVQAACDVLIERNLEAGNHVEDQLPRRARFLHIVGCGVAVVGAVVVDVQRGFCRAKERFAPAGSAEVRAVHANDRLRRACLLGRYQLIRKR